MYIDPHYAEIRGLMKQRADYQAAIANIEQVKQLRDSLETQYNDLSPDNITRLGKIIPQNLNIVKLTADLDAIAGHYSMTLRNVRVTEQASDNSAGVNAKENKPYKTTTMSFSVLGTYPSFVAFVKDVENSLQLIDIRSVSMKSTGTSSSLMQFDITIQTYWIQ
jgi:Tfp pilus assembly protein PilO